MNMAWVAVDKDGTEVICNPEPYRDTVDFMWCIESGFYSGLYSFQKVQLKNFLEENLHGKTNLWNLHRINSLQI